MPREAAKRQSLVDAMQTAARYGLNSGTSGNISLRCDDGTVGDFLISPTGIRPVLLMPDQIVRMDSQGRWQGRWAPSSEWEIHLRILATRADVGAVVHAHPDHAVALSCLRRPVPAFHYMVAGFGGDQIPCARYECFGSPALADTVIEALGDRYHGCLMANHGIIACGPDLETALARAERLETLARQYLYALSAGTPVLLSADEMRTVHERYRSYGQQGPTTPGA